LHYLFGLKGSQPTFLLEAQHWLGARSESEVDETHETVERGQRGLGLTPDTLVTEQPDDFEPGPNPTPKTQTQKSSRSGR
jgi:hypothetical protein